jgi:hypothetical protein
VFAAMASVLPATAQLCPGDCDGDGQVTVAELIRGVRISLGEDAVAECAAMDGDGNGVVTVAELIRAVRAALEFCIADTPTPTVTPLGPTCGDGTADGLEECDDGNTADGDGCSSGCELERGGNPCAGVPVAASSQLRAVRIASGLTNPVHVAAPPLDPHRIFIVEQPGRVRLVRTTLAGRELQGAPFLDIVARVSSGGERGLLSIAFHPDFERNGWFFLNYTCRNDGCPAGSSTGATIVSRFEASATADQAEVGTERVLLAIPQPAGNHNGGQIAFGPDGYLYVGMGDGGSFDDPREAGQDDDTLLGKMLRLDVDVDEAPYWRAPDDNPNRREGPLGLIWAKGVRNPWRFSFDRANGDLYIADVGQDTFEEINVQAGNSTGGENYGWDIFEGDMCFNDRQGPSDCPSPRDGFVFPVLQYGRSDGVSVTGGFVYRGCAIAALRGTYFYSDFATAWIRTFVLAGGVATQQQDRTGSITVPDGDIRAVSSYGEDARGELYIVDHGGEVFQFVAQD